MCGFVAVLGGCLPVEERVARAALDLLRHRGPDDSGTWRSDDAWLGSRRLAILDVSPRGHQPMEDAETGVVVSYNGEIYNYVELRGELEQEGESFTSGCDTEVLLRSYLRWGTRCVRRFNGIWAFVVWDPRDRTAFFARDRLGVKPFAYTLARGRMSVASEPKALLHLYPELRAVDERSLYDFLGRGKLHTSDRTMYANVRVLPPATAGMLEPGASSPRLWRYWALRDETENSAETAEAFGSLLEDSVRLRMRSDVPVGVALSGGLDSTAVLHGAASGLAESAVLTAYTSVFDPPTGSTHGDERSWARMAVAPYDRVELELVPAAEGDWMSVLERVAWHLDAPTYSPAVVPLWTIMQRARERGVKVMLEGQGGDELLGGYIHHAALAMLADPGLRAPHRLARELRHTGPAFGTRRLLLWVLRERVPSLRHTYRAMRGTAATLTPTFRKDFDYDTNGDVPPPNTLRSRLLYDLTEGILPALLHYGDAVSMAQSIESRQPFLDYRLVELCASMPAAWKVAHGQTKRVLRQYLRSVGHERIAARSDKAGFPTPMFAWLTAEGGLVPRSLLLGSDARILSWCVPRRIGDLIDRTCRGSRSSGEHLFRLLSTELWLRACIG
ncbi:MAG: asparagine synthase (glutamine-hydrolyzing) [Gaiellaceae bacterium]